MCAVRGAAGGGAAADEALLQRLRNFQQRLVHDLLGRARVIDLVEGESLVASAQHHLRLAPDLFQAALARLKDKEAGQFAFTKAGNGRYILTKKDDLVFVYDTRVGANDGADGEEKVLTGVFRAPSPIMSVSCAGDKIAVGC